MSNRVIETHDLTRTYWMGSSQVHALRGASFQVERGEFVALMGPSGSGKSTLMHLLGCLDRPTSGQYILEGTSIDRMSEDQRARAIGWVVLGGTVGGIGGPLLIGPSGDWSAQLGLDPLAGPFLVGTVTFVLGGLVTFALLRPDPSELGRHLSKGGSPGDATPARSLSQALTSRSVQTAMAAMILGQVVMTTVMTMAPLQMTEHLHHTLYDVSLVIAAHVTGMYGTSILTGRVADRLGHAKTILIGALLLITACLLAPFAADTLRLAFALFILGTGCFDGSVQSQDIRLKGNAIDHTNDVGNLARRLIDAFHGVHHLADP